MTDQLLLTRDETARQLSISPKTLWDWDRKGFGPSAIRLGSRVRYKQSEVEEFVASLTGPVG